MYPRLVSLSLAPHRARYVSRVFTGDDRPSMMARGPIRRSSTFIDPTSLNQRPTSQNVLSGSEARPNLARRGSRGGKPLLNFDEDRSPVSPAVGPNKTRSVFGVDTLWEREMAKLEEIEAQEAEELRRQEQAEALRMHKKAKKKKKGKEKVVPQDVAAEEPGVLGVEEPRVSAGAPTLPVIQRGITRGPPPPPDDDETESSRESDVGAPRPPPPKVSMDGWHSGESDKEAGGPVRTTGVGPRYPKRPSRQHATVSQYLDDDDSEEDMPLAATVSRAVERATRFGLSAAENSDSDEEKPLSQLLVKSKQISEASLTLDADNKTGRLPAFTGAPGQVDQSNDREEDDDNDDGGDEDEDNKPLGLRVSRFMSSQSQLGHADAEDDDDRALAFHPGQQRRTQYNMFLMQQQQQQQQQQQMMLQAQMQQNMMFSPPSMMGPGFFGPPVMPQMMPLVPPPVAATPPPGAQDIAKFGRVDRWRREIVGGQP